MDELPAPLYDVTMDEAKLNKSMYAAKHALHQSHATLIFYLEVFGDHLADREEYKEHKGFDALYYYLIQKHRWLPSQARSLNFDDLRFLFAEEMSGWTLPKEAL
jgi:hypothetical protein